MKKPVIALCILLMGLFFAVDVIAAEVAQGECIEYNAENHVIKIREHDTNFSKNKYGNPTSIESEFDVSLCQNRNAARTRRHAANRLRYRRQQENGHQGHERQQTGYNEEIADLHQTRQSARKRGALPA